MTKRLAAIKQANAAIEARAENAISLKCRPTARNSPRENKRIAGRPPSPWPATWATSRTISLTESRIMKTGGGFAQCYNAQAAAEVESWLILGGHVTAAPNDKQRLLPGLSPHQLGGGQDRHRAGRQ